MQICLQKKMSKVLSLTLFGIRPVGYIHLYINSEHGNIAQGIDIAELWPIKINTIKHIETRTLSKTISLWLAYQLDPEIRCFEISMTIPDMLISLALFKVSLILFSRRSHHFHHIPIF